MHKTLQRTRSLRNTQSEKQKDGLVDERRNGQRVDGVEGKIM